MSIYVVIVCIFLPYDKFSKTRCKKISSTRLDIYVKHIRFVTGMFVVSLCIVISWARREMQEFVIFVLMT